jgi:NAD(P)-dependent dehydrogenase (short-subunit alcohol dehydrogenase family)
VGDALTASDEDWARTFEVKLLGAVRLVRAVLPRMIERRSGRIVFVNGTFALTPHEAFAVNAAVNGALRGYAKALARQAGRAGITVNTVNPGITVGRLWDTTLADLARHVGAEPDPLGEALRAEVPLGRFATAEEIASAVMFFVSDESSGINGAALNVDGGHCAAS